MGLKSEMPRHAGHENQVMHPTSPKLIPAEVSYALRFTPHVSLFPIYCLRMNAGLLILRRSLSKLVVPNFK
jgi:hypothetical protein